jgi:hypothetical protein
MRSLPRRASRAGIGTLSTLMAVGVAVSARAAEPAAAAPTGAAAATAPMAPAAPAAPPAPAASSAASAPGVIDSARAGLRSGTEWLARGVDSWFGDMPFEQGGRVTDGRLTIGLLEREGDDTRFSLRFNARFRLPNVERRAYLFVGRDNPREVVTDRPGAFSRTDQLLPERDDDRRFFAGIGLDLRDAVDFRLGLRGGLKPYAQLRWRRPWRLDPATEVEARATLFWSLDDRLGATTALSWERALSPVLTLRALASGTATQDTNTLEWSGLTGMYRSFGRQRLLSFEGVINGRLDTGGAADLGLRVRWEQPLYRDWLIGELTVGHFWPRDDATTERRSAWALGGQLKLRF